MGKSHSLIPMARIERAILQIRGQNVILDHDLADMYGVVTGQLVRQVKRNRSRFPVDFAYQLTLKEFTLLKCQFGISSSWGGRRTPPWAFTEQGVAMLSSVLSSDTAIEVNLAIMRAFVRLREMLSTNKDLSRRLDELEKKYDENFRVVFDAIRQLMAPPPATDKKRRIGFHQQ
jgi:hypothetical protein